MTARRPVVIVGNKFIELPAGDTLEGSGSSGPPPISEEDAVYAKRTDMVGDTVIYRGEAVVGSAESASVWRIRRITLTDDDMTEEWASGTAAFDKAWTDRAVLGYS